MHDLQIRVGMVLMSDSGLLFELHGIGQYIVCNVDVIIKIEYNYSYDAGGVCTVVSDTTEEGIAGINPYRYRSYY